MKNCALCNEKLEEKNNESEIVEYKTSNGTKKILVDGLSYSKCSCCDEVYYNHEQLILHDKQLEKSLEKERKAKGLLTASEIKNIRKKFDITQDQLEGLLNLSSKIVVKWETYRSDQSKQVDKILRVLEKNPSFLYTLIKESTVKNVEPLLEKYLILIEHHDTIQFIKKIYPDLEEKNITQEFIKQFEKMFVNSVKKHVEIDTNKEIKLKEVI